LFLFWAHRLEWIVAGSPSSYDKKAEPEDRRGQPPYFPKQNIHPPIYPIVRI
jgi:hypothetical protein